MIKIFVINLKSSVERRRKMERQLNRLNLPFEIFDAIKGSEITESEIASYYDMNYYQNAPAYFTSGVVGCTLSHYFLYKKIVEDKIEAALILEDDMIINKSLPDLIDSISKEIRNDEVILLFYQSYFPINLSVSSAHTLKDKFKIYKVTDVKGIRSTAGYIINYEAAKKMVQNMLPISYFPDDWETFYERKLFNSVRLIYPSVLTNTYQPTTISPNLKGGNFAKKLLLLIEKNKLFPFYHLLKLRRMINTAKSRRCFLVNDNVVDFSSI